MNAFISLNKLAYGQATIEERMAIDNGTEFKAHVKVFQNDPYPENISPEAKQEVYEVTSKVEKLVDEEWRNRCFFFDRQLGKYLNGFAQKAGITQFKSIFDQVNHLYLNSLIYQIPFEQLLMPLVFYIFCRPVFSFHVWVVQNISVLL